MIFRQLTHDDLGRASSLIGDENAGVAGLIPGSVQPRSGAGQVIHVVERSVPKWTHEGWPTEQPETAKA